MARASKYELIVNLETAKALGLEGSAKPLALVDEVIEYHEMNDDRIGPATRSASGPPQMAGTSPANIKSKPDVEVAALVSARRRTGLRRRRMARWARRR
jgi:hypothetical protein